jgi:hypothetical protein
MTPAFHGLASARPNPSAARSAIGAHARRPVAAQGVGKRQRWRRSIPVAFTKWRHRSRRRTAGGRRGRRVGEGSRVRELASCGRRRCARVGKGVASGRSGASEKGAASGRSLSSGTGATRRGSDNDDGGIEVRRRFRRKRLSADLEGYVTYIEPPTFCHGSYSQQ